MMLGHGRPRLSPIVSFALIAIGLTSDVPRAIAVDLDEQTQPFHFESSIDSWPLVPEATESALTVQVRGLTLHADQELVLSYELFDASTGSSVANERTEIELDATGNSAAVSIADATPTTAGVYEIRCRLNRKRDKLWSRLSRADGKVASTRVPLLVYGRPGQRQTLQWQLPQDVAALESDDWTSTDWIPGSAGRLVPNVKRVSESLTPKTWREEDLSKQMSLGPGQSFIGVLPSLDSTRLRRLVITTRITPDAVSEIDVAVQVATDTGFDQPIQSEQFTIGIARDLATDVQRRRQTHEVLLVGAGQETTVRVTNRSSSESLVIDSIQWSATTDAENDQPADADQVHPSSPRRRIVLVVDSVDWQDQLANEQFTRLLKQDFSVQTARCFRGWIAANQLKHFAAWYPIDSLVVPPIDADSAADTDEPQSNPAWVDSILSRSLKRWMEGSRVQFHYTGEIDLPESSLSSSIGSKDANNSPALIRMIKATFATDTRERSAADWVVRADRVPLVRSQSFARLLRRVGEMSPDQMTLIPSTDAASDYVLLSVRNNHSQETKWGADVLPVFVFNSAPWTTRVRLRVSASGLVDFKLSGSNRNVESRVDSQSQEICYLTIPPATLIRVDVICASGVPVVKSWNATIAGGPESLDRLKKDVGNVVAKLGTLANPDDYDALRNGGFEVAGAIGIVGWMHTQFPKTAVVLDGKESIEGSHSVLMTTDGRSAGRTWLVSESFPVPESGRLGVSLATRAKAKYTPDNSDRGSTDPSAVHRVRVSLEGIRNETPVRYAAEFDVPCNGQWQDKRLVLETSVDDLAGVSEVRLTLDSLSPGSLWIDDVHLHDQFPTSRERNDLQSSAFLAVQGLQLGNLRPAARLLQNEWTQYLLTVREVKIDGTERLAQLNQERVGNVQTTSTQGESSGDSAQSDGEDRGGVTQRLRDWLPKPIRF